MQTTPRSQYIAQMRSRTAYPTFRALMNAYLILQYVCAAFVLIASLITVAVSFIGPDGAALVGLASLISGLLLAAIIVVIAKVFYEASMMLADIADSLLDQNAAG
jgi:hypothetical protein